MTQNSNLRSDLLPSTISGFLAAHIALDANTASTFFAENAVAVDQGQTFRGRNAIHDLFRDAGTEFTYTTEQIGAARIDDEHWVVTLRLEGNFPGGVAELDYRFSLRKNVIGELVIANHES
ncbi:nuclear transport factor 2 family protein [Kineosporia babensis]|uniref:Nuclear transport factor 2 family protein n=1 Tax=Kineosporia babensis TaxID=499548 RepID=A0A9X1ST97_9ACTN|nr:nuclear transport factor 2 family protein [Kineosporia babensis]MCD5311096.1 nuclear transport factor 2 family protein [Kineosporia babensis]